MAITINNMLDYVYDPNKAIGTILKGIQYATSDDLIITDPTNPFIMLLEASQAAAYNNLIEAHSLTRALYPSLATDVNELYHHLDDDEMVNMFAYPSEGIFGFFLNTKDLLNNGYRPDGATYIETKIPPYTTITILDTVFTLLNEIVVRLNDNGTVFVSQTTSPEEIAVNDLGILPSGITTDSEMVSWVFFYTRIRQVKKYVLTDTIIEGDTFIKTQTINNQYFYSNVKYYNGSTGNKYVKLAKALKEEYINPNIPSVYIKIAGKDIIYKIPEMYILDNNVTGNVIIETYDTKGKLYLPINKYSLKDFIVTLGDTTYDLSVATIPSIRLGVLGRDVVDGGRNAYTLEELRNAIINNSTGALSIPITYNNLQIVSKNYGFDIYKAEDTVTSRIYVATKNLPDLKDIGSELVKARCDIFINKVKFDISKLMLTNTNKINILEDIFIIKSNAVYVEDNGIVTPVTDEELAAIERLSGNELFKVLSKNKYFISPFYYVVDKADNILSTRVYDLDHPNIDGLKILNKNSNVTVSVNIEKHLIINTDTGYRIYLSLTSNEEFKKLNPNTIFGQLTIPLKSIDSYVHIKGTIDPYTGYLVFDIKTDFYITNDDNIRINNGESTIYNKYINLSTIMYVYLYTINSNVVDNTHFLVNEIKVDNNSLLTVLSKEQFNCTLGYNLKYLWNRMHVVYSTRPYLTYQDDIYLTYENDVYETFEDGSKVQVVDNNGEISVVYNKIHSKGDIVRDSDGNPIIKHKKGDVILNEYGQPILDGIGGLYRYIDIFMLEYEFYIANSNVYKNYYKLSNETILTWLNNSLANINKNVLENTKILYRPSRISKPVEIYINNIVYTTNYIVKPKILLYTTKKNITPIELDICIDKIGKILHSHLDTNTINLSLIERDILTALGDEYKGVDIRGLDSITGNLKLFNLANTSNKLTINKILTYNASNEYIVKYDIDVKIQSI